MSNNVAIISTMVGKATVVADLFTLVPISANMEGVATVQIQQSAQIPISANMNGHGTAMGLINTGFLSANMAGVGALRAAISGNVGQPFPYNYNNAGSLKIPFPYNYSEQ